MPKSNYITRKTKSELLDLVEEREKKPLALHELVGRPEIWKSENELRSAVMEYLVKCQKAGEPITMTGLAVFLGMDRVSLINYSEKSKFFDTIKFFRSLVEQQMERGLVAGKGSPIGYIFALKNNFGWVDKHEVDTTHHFTMQDVFNELSKQGVGAIDGEVVESLPLDELPES